MKPERTIQEMYNGYPTVFRTRQHCLDHLFVVVGNGYEWVDGELIDLAGPEVTCVEKDEENYEYIFELDKRLDIEKAVHPWSEDDWNKHYADWAVKTCAAARQLIASTKNEKLKKIVAENLNKLKPQHVVLPFEEAPHKWYPISWEHSKIALVPDDITPEWQKLVDECKALLLEDGIDVDNRTITKEAETRYFYAKKEHT